MGNIRITFIILLTTIFVMLLSVLAMIIITLNGYLNSKKLEKIIYNLGQGITNRKVEEFIGFLDTTSIPQREYYWNMIKAGYEIVKTDNHIKQRLIEELKITILSKGVLVN